MKNKFSIAMSLAVMMAMQLGHVRHGSPSAGRSQFNALARMRAQVVLPVPRGPVNR